MASLPRVRHCIVSLAVCGSVVMTMTTPRPTLGGNSLAERLRSGPGIINHPVNVVPTSLVRIPNDWPVGSDGTLTCLTCHERLPVPNSGGDPYLRGPSATTAADPSFCATCHDAPRDSDRSAIHWMAVGYAHVTKDRSTFRHHGGLLDSVSSGCLTCHDGVTAVEAGHRSSRSTVGYLGDRGRNHPLGVPYEARQADRHGSPLRHPMLLPKQIRLPENKVSCVSCHNLYNSERYQLSVPIEGSRLCLTCHEMD